ncbi:hypothetical protein [Bradyrhizobium sp. BR 1432]|uniref:hypothetical protein n=1 Tax=Bradyrhizobium sp. BR 1432 TaxID=3447966 RepID=UPI003EE63874
MARASFAEAVSLARSASRPWIDSGIERAQDDPHTIAALGDLQIRVHSANGMVERAARILDGVRVNPSEARRCARLGGGCRSQGAGQRRGVVCLLEAIRVWRSEQRRTSFNFDRHWRNARTHTLHDPVRWKYHLIGNYLLNGKNPPLHNWA